MNRLALFERPPKRRREPTSELARLPQKDGHPKRDDSRANPKFKSMIEAAEEHRRLQIERGREDVQQGRFAQKCCCCLNVYPDSIFNGCNAGGEPVCEYCIQAELGGAPW